MRTSSISPGHLRERRQRRVPQHRYLGPDVLNRCRLILTITDPVNEVNDDALPALTACPSMKDSAPRPGT